MRIEKLENETIIGDSIRITQVFVNILSNSVKFTPEGGNIGLTLKQTASENGYGDYVFTFTDNGIGMSEEFVGQVFDTFSRAATSDISKLEGTGLGMAIAKNLVEMMGGSISCKSELGAGTEFTVKMHFKLADDNQAAVNRGMQSAISGSSERDSFDVVDLSGKRILLVEDNAINREIAGKILSETNAFVVEACDGSEAVKAFTESSSGYFDVILMDIKMPVMDGYDACIAIRALKREDALAVPIYAMTANTFDEDVIRVKEAGMNGHIAKPYTPDTLYRILKDVLK